MVSAIVGTQAEHQATVLSAQQLVDQTRLAKLRVSAYGNITEVWPDNAENVLPELHKHQTREIVSKLLNPVITFDQTDERVRANSGRLPSSIHRTYYETSQTLCCYVGIDTHPKHREFPDLKISEENGFQSIGSFVLEDDLTRERIERQLSWNKKIEPTSYISGFDDLSHAIRRAGFHYEDSKRIGMCVSIARISTDGLIAGTVRSQMSTTVTVKTKFPHHEEEIEQATKIHNIITPVWIRNTAVPDDLSAITSQQLAASGADMWLSITEIRASDMKIILPKVHTYDRICAKGHAYEWLACGSIAKSLITRVMPWDGVRLHRDPDVRIIRSIDSPNPWIFDQNTLMWRLDPRLYRTACFLETYGKNKRMISDEERDPYHKGPSQKRRKTVIISTYKGDKAKSTPKAKRNHNPYAPDYTPDTSEQANSATGCCSACGQQKAPVSFTEEIDGPVSYLDLAMPSKTARH